LLNNPIWNALRTEQRSLALEYRGLSAMIGQEVRMRRNRIHALFIACLAFVAMSASCFAGSKSSESNADRESVEKTGAAIRAAFQRGDVAAIVSYHHPDVVKSLSYGNLLIGRDAVQKDLTATLQRFNLTWKENQVRSILIQGDTAIELTDFTIEGTPKQRGDPFIFKGRSMIVYVRYKPSPTGWASIREVIQPAT
jgi:ketosteroid isomerase-like protein